ncbi:MAG TPA: NlpC/P60 family protein, partial [Actinoplanes sp.]
MIAPTVDPVEHPAEAGPPAPTVVPATAERPGVISLLGLPPKGPEIVRSTGRSASGIPASRAAVRRPAARPAAGRAAVRSATLAVRQAARRAAANQTAKLSAVRQAAKPRPVVHTAPDRPAWTSRRAAVRESAGRRGTHRSVRHRDTTHRAAKRRTGSARSSGRPARGMGAVLAYARAQVGKRYSSGGAGPHTFDCSGLTMRAYARAGYRLPHSSGGQAARARTVSRSQARPGDLVVGPGHVG